MRLRGFFARVVVCLAGIILAWGIGLGWFIISATVYKTGDRTTDAIVVLTGAPGRINYGLNLLAEGRARLLFITGMEAPVTPQTLVSSAGITPQQIPHPERAITLGFSARNTIGNAVEAAAWIRREHIHSVRLVTSDYHMPRAVEEEFRFQIPEVALLPDPVRSDMHLTQIFAEYHKYLAARLRHALIAFVEKD